METEDRCRVIDGALHGCRRALAMPPREAPLCFAEERFTGRVRCRACGADVTDAQTREAWKGTLGPAVPATPPPKTPAAEWVGGALVGPAAFPASVTVTDIGLLLELNAERRAIAEMLEAESQRVAREDTTPHDGAIDYPKRAVVGTYATAAMKVRARIVVGIATENSTPNDDGTHTVNVRLIP